MAENQTRPAGNETRTAGQGIFREKSLERVASPEALNDYIRVTTPSVWVVLAAVVVLLVGMLCWSVFGRVSVHSEDGSTEEIAPISFVTN